MPRSPSMTCATCPRLMWVGRTSLPPGQARCLPCRRAERDRVKMQTWDCAGCGEPQSRVAVKGQRPKWCDDCRPSGVWIRRSIRLEVYERDAWTCWLCGHSVDSALIGTLDELRPSLDHVIPRSVGGSDSTDNLRLAHLWCNVVRSDGRAYSPEDFRVSA